MVFNSLNLYFSRLLSVILRTGYISLKTLDVGPNLSMGTFDDFYINFLFKSWSFGWEVLSRFR